MLTQREAFKVAFLHKCAELGLTLEETHQVVKRAGVVSDATGTVRDFVGNATKAILSGTVGGAKYLVGGALVAPPLLGYIGGHLLAKGSDLTDEDAAEAKQRQLAAEYRRLANDLNSRQKRQL